MNKGLSVFNRLYGAWWGKTGKSTVEKWNVALSLRGHPMPHVIIHLASHRFSVIIHLLLFYIFDFASKQERSWGNYSNIESQLIPVMVDGLSLLILKHFHKLKLRFLCCYDLLKVSKRYVNVFSLFKRFGSKTNQAMKDSRVKPSSANWCHKYKYSYPLIWF